MGIQPLGKLVIIVGVLLVIIGVLMVVAPKIPYIGRLPGDIYLKRDNFIFYFPVVSSILLSIVLSLILYFVFRGR